jgi:hypothetical protein
MINDVGVRRIASLDHCIPCTGALAACGRKRKFVAVSVTQQEAVDFATSRPVAAAMSKTSHLFRKATAGAIVIQNQSLPHIP